ncbi:hypothetical protein DFS34DRAFT_145660 [Phlyctochytrium arcticum]|nr:hypothetical protein DFS34DRAFT_145660 [Phlyctochytrium arcticum]
MIPIGDSIITTLYIDFGIQLVSFLISAPLKTERYYDLSGAITFFSCTLTALLWRRASGDSVGDLSARQILVAVLVILWCVRLGSFLFLRASKHEDHRFDQYKHSPAKFWVVWFMQAIWVFLTAFPVYLVLANDGRLQRTFGGPSDIIGLLLWIYGYVVEVTADTQKYIFKSKHPKDFVHTGIWKYCRYANYNGEISLWIGMFILCARGFQENWQYVSILSPMFVAFLIICVSGVKLQEKATQERYGDRQDFIQYRDRTSKYFLWFPKKQSDTTSGGSTHTNQTV